MPISTLLASNPKPNVLILITDQERNLQTWPTDYQPKLLAQMPAMQQLLANGLNLPNTFAGACMCSPSRATFLTSQYPVVTGVTTTGTPEPPTALPLPSSSGGMANLATVMSAAGYSCYWIGKWHLGGTSASDGSLESYGFDRWDPPDSGNTLGPTYLGGGTRGPAPTNQNDQRYLADATAFLQSPPAEPWCLVVSLVNPHDSHLGYERSEKNPSTAIAGTFYDSASFDNFGAPLPSTANEDLALADKPRAQAGKAWSSTLNPGTDITPPTGADAAQTFVDFYAYLISYVEGQLGKLLGQLSADQLEQTLIIRLADHGEMAMSHNLVEKFDSAYDEIMNVPLIFSNPVAWPSAQSNDAMVSLVDLVPTLASLFGVASQFSGFTGRDLTKILNGESDSAPAVVHFTYDDIGGPGPSVIRAIRTSDYKYAVYFHSTEQGSGGDYPGADWEMYDLNADPDETTNLAGNPDYAAEQASLDAELQAQMKAKHTAPSFSWPPPYVAGQSRGGPPKSTRS